MFGFIKTPFEFAWDIIRRKSIKTDDGRVTVFKCPDCEMPIDQEFQRTNVRIETITSIPKVPEQYYILSCPWCYRVINIGTVADVDKQVKMARKETDGAHKG